MNVGCAIGTALAKLGVSQVFGLVGSGNFVATNALIEGGSSFVAARHESGAICMADGYARISGQVGVASVHQGPGFTNAITGLVESAKAHTPLLVLAADTPSAWLHSNFKIDQAKTAKAVGATVERIHSPETALADVARAYNTAARGKAVVLLMPIDIQGQEINGPFEIPSMPDVERLSPSPASVEAVIEAIVAAKRPLIIAGRGAVTSNAKPDILSLADLSGALLATSMNGHGLFAKEVYSLGISGGFAPPTVIDLLGSSDLVLVFGASLNRWTTRQNSILGPEAKVIHIDVDPEALGRELAIDIGVVADARLAAKAFSAALSGRGFHNIGARTQGVETAIALSGFRNIPFEDQSTEATVDPRSVTIALDDRLPAERIIVVDSGHFSGWPTMYMRVPDPQGFIFNQAFQSVGVGLGAAIGASVARPDRITIAALGDGGFFMSMGDVDTAVRHQLPLMILVYNDSAYGAEVHHFAPGGHDLGTVTFPDSDIAAIGRAMGCSSATVRRVGDLAQIDEWLAGPIGPMVVDLKIERSVIGGWLHEAFRA